MADRDSKDSKDKFSYDGGSKALKYDDPPNSRLFIVCNKNITEEDFRNAFSKYGTIEEIWVVKDRSTHEPKGVTYIKFLKTSEAALALEEMNGECIGSHPRPLKVMIAHSRDQGSKREMNEEERLLRLFCVVPKSMTDQGLREHFQQFGDIDYVSVVKDRDTKESKGFAYVKYHRVSHAARAFEGCDRSFRAVFAEPKRQKTSYDTSFERYSGGPPSANLSFGDRSNYMDGSSFGSCTDNGSNTLRVIASPTLNQDQLWRLFDLIPGLEYLQLDNKNRMGKGHAVVVYNNLQAAQWAREKLHGFEFPPGQRLIVRQEANDSSMTQPMQRGNGTRATGPQGMSSVSSVGGRPPGLQTDLATLAETIAQATSLIQAAGLAPGMQGGGGGGGGAGSLGLGGGGPRELYDPSYCSVKLPGPQPLAPIEAEVAERLFIVCQRGPPPLYAMRDVFGRFGNLIDVYMLGGKNCGYAKYAKKESAQEAIQTMHGQEILGVRLKVMAADPQTDDRRKRLRMDMDDQ